jgi:hypothetical protein
MEQDKKEVLIDALNPERKYRNDEEVFGNRKKW